MALPSNVWTAAALHLFGVLERCEGVLVEDLDAAQSLLAPRLLYEVDRPHIFRVEVFELCRADSETLIVAPIVIELIPLHEHGQPVCFGERVETLQVSEVKLLSALLQEVLVAYVV